MKKILSVVSVLLCLSLLLCSCGEGAKSEAVLAVEEMIEAISDDITPETGAELDAARAAYEALPESEQPKMKKLKRLEKLEAEFAEFDGVKSYVEEVAAIAGGEFSKSSKFSELLDKAEEMKQAYKKLPKDQQAQITGMDALDQNLEAIRTHIENAKKATVTYVQAFLKLNEKKNYEITNVYCLDQIGMDGEDMYLCALAYKDESGAAHTVYSNARYGVNTSPEILLSRAEYVFSEVAPVGGENNENDPVLNGNVMLDAAEIVATAKETLANVKMPVTEAATQAESTAAAGETTTVGE